MGIQISQSEKLDIFFALALLYEFKITKENESDSQLPQLELAFQALSALGENDLKQLKERARSFESLSQEKQKNWQMFWLEKLRHRGHPQRLDESIHTDQIVNVLIDEPDFIQKIIFKNLPVELANDVEGLFPKFKSKSKKSRINLPNEKISKVVRDKFLSYFVAFEDIYQPNSIDELTFKQLEKFIWKLGIRETAISCRGIKTKESLAVFLKPFDEAITKEIALHIKELEDIKPKRILYSETLVNKVFDSDTEASEWITNLGLLLLALTFAFRDEIAIGFIKQKFSIEIAKKFGEFIKLCESDKIENIDEVTHEIIEIAGIYKELTN